MTSPAPATAAGPNLLVLAPNWLGDVVMTTPLLSLLAELRDREGRRPRIILAVRQAWEPLFAADPRVHRTVPIARPGAHAGLRGVPRLAARLREEACAAAILGPPSLRAALLARLAGVRVRVGHAGDGRSALLSRAVPRRPRGTLHFCDEMLELGSALVEELGWNAPPVQRGMVPDLPGLRAADDVAQAGERPLWVLGPGATYGEAKTWPARNLAELAALAVERHGARVVLAGDAASRGFLAGQPAVAGLRWGADPADGAADIFDAAGRTSLAQAVVLLRGARMYVGNDSGLMHLAAALGVPTVGVFGSSNPDWTAPRGRRTAAVAADGFACRPCYRRRCNQPRFCLDTVDAATVLDVAGRLLAGPSTAAPEERP